jgi:hypothetical protein
MNGTEAEHEVSTTIAEVSPIVAIESERQFERAGAIALCR